jgi:TolB-like protein/Tfp pilus assembly protein PilF
MPVSYPGSTVTSTPPPRLSIVVLPFTNLSNDPEQEYFADGVTDDLTSELSRISDSFVIARTTAFSYKGKPVDVRQIGRELGVRYVLEGSVRRASEQVQVNVQLIDTETGAHIWVDRFDTDRANLAKAQDEIVGRLGATLHFEILEAAATRIERENPSNPDARDLLMRGWASYHRPLSAENREAAMRAFEQALEIDPTSIGARVGIATILGEYLAVGWSKSREQDMARAEQLLLEALARDRNNSRALFEIGRLRRLQSRLLESKIELEKAIALDRNHSGAILQLGITLLFLGQPRAALSHVEKALQLNPHHQNVFYFYYWWGHCHLLLAQLDQAVDLLMKARVANPKFPYTGMLLAGALALRGDIDEARAVWSEARELGLDRWFKSIAELHANSPGYMRHPAFVELREQTIEAGLRRIGVPEE